MPKADRLHIILMIALFTGFLVGTWVLMVLRFERGDVYPAYSSMRSDPLGTRAFFDSLASLENIRVNRHMRPLKELNTDGDAALFILGVSLHPANALLREEADALDDFMAVGGRVIITLLPRTAHGTKEDETDTPDSPGNESASDSKVPDPISQKDSGSNAPDHDEGVSGKRPPSDETAPPAGLSGEKSDFTTLKKRWGISTAVRDGEGAEKNEVNEYAIARAGRLPRTISWHSALYFKDQNPVWKTLYTVANEPVMVERPIGKGSLVLASDSYLLSNEAMKSERLPDLLLYLVDRSSTIIIDETHHGLRQREGVIGYLRAHRLHWILLAMLTVAGLFVWKNAVPLVPPENRRAGADRFKSAETRNATQGLANLLRRNIPPKQLLKICFEQWEKAFKKNVRYTADRRERARQIIENPGTKALNRPDPVSDYRAISRTLAEDQPNE